MFSCDRSQDLWQKHVDFIIYTAIITSSIIAHILSLIFSLSMIIIDKVQQEGCGHITWYLGECKQAH